MTPDNLYQPKLLQRFVFDILPYAQRVADDLDDYLKTASHGIYSASTGKLLMNKYTYRNYGKARYYRHDTSGRPLYLLDTSKGPAHVPLDYDVHCIDDLREPVYDADFNCVINSRMLADPHRFLRNESMPAAVGVDLIMGYLDYRINYECLYPCDKYPLWGNIGHLINVHVDEAKNRPVRWYPGYDRLIATKPSVEEVVEWMLDQCMRDFVRPILDAGGWAIIEPRMRGNRLSIDIFEDYRIVQWMRDNGYRSAVDDKPVTEQRILYADVFDVFGR